MTAWHKIRLLVREEALGTRWKSFSKSPEPWGYCIFSGLGVKKNEDSCFPMQRGFHCTCSQYCKDWYSFVVNFPIRSRFILNLSIKKPIVLWLLDKVFSSKHTFFDTACMWYLIKFSIL